MSLHTPKQGQFPDSWPLTPDQKAFAHLVRLNFRRPEAEEGNLATSIIIPDDAVRSRAVALLNKLEGRVSPEQEKLMDQTSEQYDVGFAAWKSTFQLPHDALKTLASKDTVMQWAATVQTETIQGLQQYGGEPRLKLLPDMPVSALIQIIDQHRMFPAQHKGCIGWDQWKKVAAPAGSFGLTTDIKDMPFDSTIFYQDAAETVKRTNEEMVAEYKRRFQQTQGATIMPQYAYVSSAMDAMARGQKYDERFWTVFERPQGDGVLPDARWLSDHVNLSGVRSDGSYSGFRARVWVPGEKA